MSNVNDMQRLRDTYIKLVSWLATPLPISDTFSWTSRGCVASSPFDDALYHTDRAHIVRFDLRNTYGDGHNIPPIDTIIGSRYDVMNDVRMITTQEIEWVSSILERHNPTIPLLQPAVPSTPTHEFEACARARFDEPITALLAD